MSNEQIIRNYLSNLSLEEIANSIHLIGLNFERDKIDDILNAIISLYLDVAETAKLITNGFVKNGNETNDNPDEKASLIDEYELKRKVLDKLLDYNPIAIEVSKRFQEDNNCSIKQTC